MIRAVLFDFDGVLCDTESSNSDFFCRALAAHGVTLTDAERNAMIGTNDRELILSYIMRCRPPISYDDFIKERRALGTTYENKDIHPEPGCVACIRRLREAGIRTAVVSSTVTRLIVTALNRMGMTDLFDAIVCGDMTEEHKPSPVPYLKAMSLLKVEPSDCLVVEDSSVGIHAGKAAGAAVAAYTGTNSRHDMSEADTVFGDFRLWDPLA